MATGAGRLTAVAVRNATAKVVTQRLFDGGGLYLEIAPAGARYWRMKYRFAGKEKRLAFGVYPAVSLTDARSKRDAAREAIRTNRDPSAEKRANKLKVSLSAETTFEAIGREWLATQKKKLAASTYKKSEWLLGNVWPWLGARPIAEIEPPELLQVLRRIESRGANETAHRAKDKCGQVFRYAIASGRATRDPTADLRNALAPVVTRSHPALTAPGAIAGLLRAIDAYQGQPATMTALKLAPLLFARPGNLRAMEWSEIDLSASEWRIPAGKMKMREAHIVPLPTQAVELLRDFHPLTAHGRYCFPSVRTSDRPMSENTINAALRSLGFDKETMTGHGFRAMASTRLNEMGWAPDVIERQLAHTERNKVRAVYNRAQYIAERRTMMQAWADYLDALRSDAGKIVAIKHRTASPRQ